MLNVSHCLCKHPAVQVEYLLKKISTAMSVEWDGDLLEDLLSQEDSVQEGISVWEFLEFMDTGRLMRIDSMEAFSLALDDVFMEMYHNVLKKVGHLKIVRSLARASPLATLL